jgi:hypothetical protein
MRGSGGWLLSEDGFGPWRSTSVCFLMLPCLFFNKLPFPFCKAQLIGDLHENRQGAPNRTILLLIRQYYLRFDAYCANSNGGLNTKKFGKHNVKILLAHSVWSALPIDGEVHQSANILAHRCTLAPKLKYWRTHDPCTNSIGEPMHPAPLLMVHRTQKINKKVRILNRQGRGSFGVPIIDENNFISVVATSFAELKIFLPVRSHESGYRIVKSIISKH